MNLIEFKVYENFIEEIDAIDNGVDQFDGEARYKITTNLSARVGKLNPDWNDDSENENVIAVTYCTVLFEYHFF